MIILDTNQLKAVQPPNGALCTMLVAVADHAGHKLVLPEIAFEEHLAHYGHEVKELHQKARTALRAYSAKLGTMQSDDLSDLNLIPIMESVRSTLREIFTILPTPDWAGREAMLREARRQAPAATNWQAKGEGSRDAAIWLTAVEALRTSEETIHFVSTDKRAFGDGTLLNDLAADLGEAADRFVYCCGVEVLLDKLAKRHTAKIGQNEIESSAVVLDVVRTASMGSQFFFSILSGAGLGGEGIVASRTGDQKFSVTGIKEMVTYMLPGREKAWACANVQWRLEENVTATLIDLNPSVNRTIHVSFGFSATLLMELSDGGDIDSASMLHVGGMRDFKAEVVE
ncbi:PIN domain-containing protein [Nonomuraea sp. NPDC049637]|uniref:PIN domain-containing protein n=1 Tax=Nonomuraea sp. NPDC049637 TaxID=3154356 RepID=UPI003436C74B